MPSILRVTACALVALALWTAIGWPLARRFFDRTLALPFAPIVGWAVHGTVAILVFQVVPFGTLSVVLVALTVGLGLAVAVRRSRAAFDPTAASHAALPAGAVVVAAIVAAIVATAILPKDVDGVVRLSDQIFDHAKIALVEDIARHGLPPGNPYIAPDAAHPRLAYYYLWHFGAAELSRVLSVSGWEADVAMTFFSAFVSLVGMMAVATRFGGGRAAAYVVAAIALTETSRPVLDAVFGAAAVHRWLQPAGGFGGWMFQSSWTPQQVAAASCVIVAVLLADGLAARRDAWRTATLALVVAAAFESSTWIGGVVQAIVFAAVVPWIVVRAPDRARLVARLAIAGVVALAVAAPLLLDQIGGVASRQHASPIVISPWPVFGDAVPRAWRAALDVPGWWLVWLPVEWTAAYLCGLAAIARVAHRDRSSSAATLAVATLASLLAACLLVSTLADNNDLGWRAALLASMLLVPFAAIAIVTWARERRLLLVALSAVAVIAGLFEGSAQIAENVVGAVRPSSPAFARAPAMWARVRALTGDDERVANDPLALADMTPWPVNLGWALFARRRSCYATWELTQVFSSIPHDALRVIDDRFVRVFAGEGSDDDVRAVAAFGCDVVVVVPEDGAWSRDPFATSADYRLVDESPDRWRIYRKAGTTMRR